MPTCTQGSAAPSSTTWPLTWPRSCQGSWRGAVSATLEKLVADLTAAEIKTVYDLLGKELIEKIAPDLLGKDALLNLTKGMDGRTIVDFLADLGAAKLKDLGRLPGRCHRECR